MAEASTDPLDWWVVIDESLGEEEEPPDEDPELAGVPAILLRELRAAIPVWRSLGITDDDTYAAYGEGRLKVNIDIVDRVAPMSIGCLRAEVTDAEWIAGWASPSLATQPAFEDTDPDERTGGSIVDPDKGVVEVIGWFKEQLGRPIDRRVWRAGDDVVGEVWSLGDSGRALVGLEPSEDAEQLGPAVETVRVRG